MTTSLRQSHIKFSFLSDVVGRVLARPPSLTNISDTVSYFLARAFSKTWKKTKIYHGSELLFLFFLFYPYSPQTKHCLIHLKKIILQPYSHFPFSLRVWGEVRNAPKQHLCRQRVNDTGVTFISLTPWLMDFLQSTYTYTHSLLCLHK